MGQAIKDKVRWRSITVNAIAPGPTATDLFLNGKSQELIDHMAKLDPPERLRTPQDIAAAVSFLAGPDGAWINGQVLRANVGRSGYISTRRRPARRLSIQFRTVSAELLRRIGPGDLLTPRDLAAESRSAAQSHGGHSILVLSPLRGCTGQCGESRAEDHYYRLAL